MREELKPCPFCGASAELLKIEGSYYFIRHIKGYGCLITCNINTWNEEAAIREWNQRATEQEKK